MSLRDSNVKILGNIYKATVENPTVREKVTKCELCER